jgi:putative DNA primase/helicase
MVRDRSVSGNGRTPRQPTQPLGPQLSSNGQHADQGEPLVLTTAASIKPGKRRWLWTGRFCFGFPSLLEGKKERGKSTLLAAIAAHLTGGPALPGERRRTRKQIRDVLWIAGEEDSETVVGKLLSAGANVRRIHFPRLPNGRRPCIPSDLDALARTAAAVQAGLLVLDPASAVKTPGLCLEQDDGADAFMQALLDWCETTGCCAICTRNLVKHTSGMDALAQGRGSGTLADRARSVLRCDRYPDEAGTYALSVTACNLGDHGATLLYRVAKAKGSVHVTWHGASDMDADRLSLDALDAGEQDTRADAQRLLTEAIGNAWRAAKEILAEAEKAGINAKTLRRAKADLKIPSRRSGGFGAAGFFEWGPPLLGWATKRRAKRPD